MRFIKRRLQFWWSHIKKQKSILLLIAFVKNKDVLVFAIFLFISTFIWFFNALRDKYETDFVFSLRLVNVPANQILLNSNTQKISVKVQSTGYTLLRQYISNSFVPINYDVNKLHSLIKGEKEYLLSREQFNVIKEQLLVGIELLKISPDTIFIELEPKEEKKVPVQLLGEVNFQQQYLLSGDIYFQPESVLVSGQKSVVDTLTTVYTEKQKLSDLSDTLRKVVNLMQYKNLLSEPNQVELIVPVEPFSERMFSVPIEVLGMSDSLRLKVFPTEVKVTFRAGLSQLEKINESDFKVTVDASQLRNNHKIQRLRVALESKPTSVKFFDLSPLYVEYLIERRR